MKRAKTGQDPPPVFFKIFDTSLLACGLPGEGKWRGRGEKEKEKEQERVTKTKRERERW